MKQTISIFRLIFALALLLATFGTKAQQYGLYTLYSVQNSNTTQLIDTNSTVYKTWTHTGAKTGYSSYLMPGGILWRTVSNTSNVLNGGGITGRVQKVAWDGTILWDYVYSSSTYCLHHDICPLPNGNVLLISYDVKTSAQATQAGSATTQNQGVWSEKIIEVQPTGATTGTIVWEWKAWDHLVQNANPAKDNYQTSIVAHPEKINLNYKLGKDWMHMNGVDYNPILDQIAFSSHNLNEWYIIDHSTSITEAATGAGGNSGKGGDILYRWGNPAAYGASGTTILNVTHDAHWIPEGFPNAGRLVGFNNKGVSSSQSSVDQVIPPISGYNYTHTAGQAYTPSTYTQRLACNGYSSNMGNSYQLPNGNMLVCVATSGLIYEVNPAGTTIWSKNAGGTCAQAFRYSSCYVNTPAPALPTITAVGEVLTSSAAATYQWYKNGVPIQGATNQTYNATEAGVYLVRVTEANTCDYVYSYSKGQKVTVSAPLDVSVLAANPSICIQESAVLQANATGGTGTTSFSWSSDPAGFTSDLQNPMVSPVVTTIYKVVATNGLEKDSATVTIQVNPLPPTPVITQNVNALTSSPGVSYLWYLNGVLQPGLTTQTISPTADGDFQVRILDANGCKSELSDTLNFIFTSIVVLSERAEVVIFPNPASNHISLSGRLIAEGAFQVRVVDVMGKTVVNESNQTRISVSHLPEGLYFVEIIDDQHGRNQHKVRILR